MEAIILLGGMGTRLLPYTKTIPKEMLPIYDVPAIFLQVKEAYLAGIRRIILVVTEHNIRIIQEFFSSDDYLNKFLEDKPDKKILLEELNKIINEIEFIYVLQKDKGTYGALYSAKDKIKNDNFIVMYGDDLFLSKDNLTKELINKFMIDHYMYTTIIKKDYNDLPNVGIVKLNDEFLDNLVPKDEVNEGFILVGRMLLNKKIFDIKESLFKHQNDELYLSYALLKFRNNVKTYLYQDQYFNLGERTGYIKASISYALQKNDQDIKKYIKEIK